MKKHITKDMKSRQDLLAIPHRFAKDWHQLALAVCICRGQHRHLNEQSWSVLSSDVPLILTPELDRGTRHMERTYSRDNISDRKSDRTQVAGGGTCVVLAIPRLLRHKGL